LKSKLNISNNGTKRSAGQHLNNNNNNNQSHSKHLGAPESSAMESNNINNIEI
jgi:hypothetical protein